MGRDFEQYENDYIRRISQEQNSIARNMMTVEQMEDILLQENAVKIARKAELNSWDYAILEMLRRNAIGIELKFGTVRTTESLLKLYSHDFIRVVDYEPTFDELEIIQSFLDSSAYKQYLSRLEKIITAEVQKRIELVYRILNISIKSSFWQKIKGPNVKMFNHSIELTHAGKKILDVKRTEALMLYEKTNKQYLHNKLEFHQNVETMQPESMMLPLMLAMGLSGAMVGHMASVSGSEYVMLYDEFGKLNMPFDAGHGTDFDFSGSDYDMS